MEDRREAVFLFEGFRRRPIEDLEAKRVQRAITDAGLLMSGNKYSLMAGRAIGCLVFASCYGGSLREASRVTTMRIALLVPMGCLLLAVTASAQDQGRIKRKPPTNVEAERIASEMVMSDSLLQKGDIVVTDRGFFVFRGLAVDGYTYEFSPVPNPGLIGRSGR